MVTKKRLIRQVALPLTPEEIEQMNVELAEHELLELNKDSFKKFNNEFTLATCLGFGIHNDFDVMRIEESIAKVQAGADNLVDDFLKTVQLTPEQIEGVFVKITTGSSKNHDGTPKGQLLIDMELGPTLIALQEGKLYMDINLDEIYPSIQQKITAYNELLFNKGMEGFKDATPEPTPGNNLIF